MSFVPRIGPLAAIQNFDTEQAVTAGTSNTSVNLTGATIKQGDTYWGSPNTALPLNMTVNGSGHLLLPDDNAVYDVDARVAVLCDVADSGKLVGVSIYGDDTGNTTVWVPVLPTGWAVGEVSGLVYIFPGDGPTTFQIMVDASLLTEDASVMGVSQLHVIKRP